MDYSTASKDGRSIDSNQCALGNWSLCSLQQPLQLGASSSLHRGIMGRAFLSTRSEAAGGRLGLVFQQRSKCLKVDVQMSRPRRQRPPAKKTCNAWSWADAPE